MSEWIKCSERLPESGFSVTAWGILGTEHAPAAHEAFLSRSKDPIKWLSVRTCAIMDDWVKLSNVTHWQPLPEAPNED